MMTQIPIYPRGSFSSKESWSSSSPCFLSTEMATPMQHVEEIRRTKFSIGGEPNPLIEDLHQAVKNLSAELYTKDVHFLMELIQNAEDNQYDEGVHPSLEFIITSRDITATGAPATLLIFNNEKGFSPRNIESICSVGRSTKKGNRSSGYIGEKGIGFKSVFLITSRPCIFSNGYQIRLNEEPCPHCGLGYIVPEWVEENPTLFDLKQIYRAGDTLPTTTIVLPLKPDKVKPVKQQLSSIHPEVLLFLSKIKRLSVREENENPKLHTISNVAISSEINFVTRKNINAESYTLRLSAEENDDSEEECIYYMWKQKFPVRPENRVERRLDVEEWVITLAFPNQERLNRGMSLPGVYAFLPTEMVTNFPFIIQADFVLASSRETILLDDKWNQGILCCIPCAFMDALKALVITIDDAPVSSLPRMFKFLPVNSSSYEKLNAVREKIKAKVVEEKLIPIETYKEQKHFYKPCEVGRLLPAFWDILAKARAQGVYLLNLSSHGRYVLNSSFDKVEYDHILNFLGVQFVNNEWYAKCIQSSNLVEGVSEDVYLEILQFVADNWGYRFRGSSMTNVPLIKYVGSNGGVSYFSVNECSNSKSVSLAERSQYVSWLIDWNNEFRCKSNRYFMPGSTQQAIRLFPQRRALLEWLGNQVNVTTLNVHDYANHLLKSLNSKNDRKLVIAYAHFLYHSFSKCYMSKIEVENLCGYMPLVDSYGNVSLGGCRVGVLVPANISKWAELIVSNPWRSEGFVELGEEYLHQCLYAGQLTQKQELLGFLKTHVGALDIPHISPPDTGFSGVDTPLTKENAFLLLEWVRHLKSREMLPNRFLRCIKEGSWLKVTVNGWRPPSESFLIGSVSSLENILQSASVLVDIPLVDQSYYGDRIYSYNQELKTIGVMFSFGEACRYIGKELMSRAASFTLSKGHVLLILNFIRYLRKKLFPLDQFVNSIKEGSWLRTSRGYRSPVGSVLYDSEWETAFQISDIPFIDQSYYGEEIYQFIEELEVLGVIVGFNRSYQLIVDHLKPSRLVPFTAKAIVLMMECIRFADKPAKLVTSLTGTKCLKTKTMGFKEPRECYLFDPAWGCILEVFNGFPVIDHDFYGAMHLTFKNELKQIGVVVDFEGAIKAFGRVFEQKAKQSSFNKQHVESFLSCFRLLKGNAFKFPKEFKRILCDSKWLRTRLGDYRSPRGCILFGPEWESISAITCLPFIDDGDNFYGKGIHEFKEELKIVGVVTELKGGLEFVSTSLMFPSDPSAITPEHVFSLLECTRLLLREHIESLDHSFIERLSKKWLKTHAGYRSPDQCLLFDSQWNLYLNPTDGPFIDESFYGPKILSYKKELIAMGVTVDLEKGRSLIARHLQLHSEFSTITQTYRYLSKYNWKPEDEDDRSIWIPTGNEDGVWIDPDGCVIHDEDELFDWKFNVLDKYYDKKLLSFFSSVMDVKQRPSVDDYIELWNGREISGGQLSNDECSKFWTFISKHWNQKTEKMLAESLVNLPVRSASGILLSGKQDVFIADNLHLKNLFVEEDLFVWYPEPSLASLPMSKLLEIYRKIGVRTISESVHKEKSSLLDAVELTPADRGNYLIGKGLVMLILGFLACSNLKMEAEKRHKAVQGLLRLSVHQTLEPVTVSYSLSLSSGEMLTKEANGMIRWERESSKFFTQKFDWSSRNADMIKYATYFSEEISVGVLCENVDHVHALSELIKLAFLLKFDEEAVEFLMESNDLQIFLEDEEFLSSAFPPA